MAGNPYTWSTTAATNATADSDINWAEGQVPGTVNGSARGMMAGVAGWLKDTNGSITSTGSANAYAVTSNVSYSAHEIGLRISFNANHTNTGASTLALNSLGIKDLKTYTVNGYSSLSAGMIQANSIYNVVYHTGAGAWLLLNPSTPPSASDAAVGVVELATSAETITGTDTARAVTPAGLQAKVASDTAMGIVELATTTESKVGTDTSRAVTAAGVKTAKQWTVAVITATDAAWAVPSNTTEMIIEVWGGGGSGGGRGAGAASTDRGPGGGAGAYGYKHYKGTIDSTLNITIGAGGTAVTDANGNAGGNTTVVGSSLGTIQANGGNGGARGSGTAGGNGGAVSTTADIELPGGGGGASLGLANWFGTGGDAPRGGMGGKTNVGTAGSVPGGGGSGENHAGGNSGAGARGQVHIWTR